MKLFSIPVELGLLTLAGSICFAAPTALNDVSFSPNEALVARAALEKREVFMRCSNQAFSNLLTQAIQDARDIIQNMADHLDLVVSLYREDESGALKPEKSGRESRSFDENNAFRTYNFVIAKIYWGSEGESTAQRNKDGLSKLKGTRDKAKTMIKQYDNYLAGQSVPWLREGFPYISIYCDDGDHLSATNSKGLTYIQSENVPNPSLDAQGNFVWWVSQTEGAEMNRREIWVPRRRVCAVTGNNPEFRFGLVRADSGIQAYVYGALLGLLEETMTFCPVHFNTWQTRDRNRNQQGVHYRDLHVGIGDQPTHSQRNAANTLLQLPDFGPGQYKGVRWLSEFLVGTMIHESTHSEAFVGFGNRLLDIECEHGRRTTNLQCLRSVAKGEDGLDRDNKAQGHKDAEAFAIYAMAMWVNTVTWYVGLAPAARPV